MLPEGRQQPDQASNAIVNRAWVCHEGFTNKEIVDLTILVGLINVWNRIGVGFRLQHPADDHA